MLLNRIQNSLYERARFYVRNKTVKRLLDQHQIPGPWLGSLDLLQTLLTARANLPTVPPTLVDVGAHKGLFARAADQVLKFECIICIEPDLNLLQELRSNTPPHKTSIHSVALAETSGEATLYLHHDPSMNSLLPSDPQVLRDKFPTDVPEMQSSCIVNTTTLDQLIEQTGALDGRPIFLKLDTQGNELNILRAGERTLQCTKACLVEHMFCTPYVTCYRFHDIVSFMHHHNFRCVGALSITRRPSHEISAVDFLFLRDAT